MLRAYLVIVLWGILPSLVFGQFVDGEKSIEFEVYHINGVNTSNAEFSPVVLGDKLIFTSDKEYNGNTLGEGSWAKNGFLNLYEAKQVNILSDSAEFSKAKLFSYQLLNDDHTGPICFNREANQAYFTQVSHKDRKLFGKTVKHPQIHRAEIVKGKWQVMEKLPFNNLSYSYGHPALSEDENTLYYVSDEIGGKGGRDLYKVTRTENGWSDPVNIEALNSEANEMFPTIHKGVLYFASDRSGGNGGLDVYACKIDDEGYGDVQNLGAPINSANDDFSLVYQPSNETGFFASNRDGGKGSDDIYFFKGIEAIKVGSDEIAGQFEYKNLAGESPEGLEVMLVDDNGDIVYKTKTDKDGKFSFKNISGDGNYTIKMIGEDGKELVLTLFGDDSDAVLLSNDEGEFVYRKLSGDNLNTLDLIAEEDIDFATNTANLKGQFIFQNLSFEDPGKMEVFLVDDEGNIVQRTMTDEHGNFEFKNINAEKSYLVQLDEGSPNLALLIYNKDNKIRSQLLSDSQGRFVFKKLSADYENSLSMLTDEASDLKFPELKMHVLGEFVYEHIDSEYPSLVDFEVYDANMNLVYEGKSGEKGGFRLVNLALTDELIFKIPEDSPYFKENIKLNILEINKDVLVRLNKDIDGFFRYRFIDGEMDSIDTIDEGDLHLTRLHAKKIPNIYFDRGGASLSTNQYVILNEVADVMKLDSKLFIRLEGHASSTSSNKYNMYLSQKRMLRVRSYLLSKGVEKSQIDGHYYGEEKLINDCPTEESCSEELHKQNRRVELKLFYK